MSVIMVICWLVMARGSQHSPQPAIINFSCRTCDADRAWSGSQPECKEINCGWPNNGIFPNGWFEASRTNLNAVITFRLDVRNKPLWHFLKFWDCPWFYIFIFWQRKSPGNCVAFPPYKYQFFRFQYWTHELMIFADAMKEWSLKVKNSKLPAELMERQVELSNENEYLVNCYPSDVGIILIASAAGKINPSLW